MEVTVPEEVIHRCENIGPAERRMRERAGMVSAAISLLGIGAVVELHLGLASRLLLALPVFISAISFLQAQAHTCVAFARANLKVLGDSRRDAVQVTDAVERAAFAKKARELYLQSLAVTLVVVALVIALP